MKTQTADRALALVTSARSAVLNAEFKLGELGPEFQDARTARAVQDAFEALDALHREVAQVVRMTVPLDDDDPGNIVGTPGEPVPTRLAAPQARRNPRRVQPPFRVVQQ